MKFTRKFSYLDKFGIHIAMAPDKVHICISVLPISLPNPIFDNLLEPSHRDDSNKLSNIGFGEEITQVELIEVKVYKCLVL